jgi:hypothetical protein
MQFQVPQFIETEDHIIGPLTIKEFIYVCATCGFAMMLFFILNTVVWVIVATPIVALGLAMAFVKVNGRSFVYLVQAAAKFYWNPQLYVWQAEHLKIERTTSRPAGGGAAAIADAFSVEKIAAGLSLKSAWRQVQTGSAAPPGQEAFQKSLTGFKKESYEIMHRITGERKAARRVDYR